MGSAYTDYHDGPGVRLGCLEFDRVLAFTLSRNRLLPICDANAALRQTRPSLSPLAEWR